MNILVIGERNKSMKNKHLTLDDRNYIQKYLNENKSLREITIILDKSPSTISNEILKHRIKFNDTCFNNRTHKCKHVDSCPYRNGGFCNNKCEKFELYVCPRLLKPPYVCNGCEKWSRCRNVKYKYDSISVYNDYKFNLSDSRQGPDISSDDMAYINNTLKPLVEAGQSIYQITQSVDLPVKERTLYNYIDLGYLPSIKNIDLIRKVKYKVRNSKSKRPKNTNIRKNRTYEDFLKYTTQNPSLIIVEMDTVEGQRDGIQKCLLTLTWRNSTFLLSILLDKHDSNTVIEALDSIQSLIGLDEFKRIFPIILTDNGNEFTDVNRIEKDKDGNDRCKVFYCDPCASWQKGMCEKNHTYIRRIIPKGVSMNDLTKSKISLMNSHINSTPRKTLNNNTPYDLAKLLLGKNIINKFKIEYIKKDKVILKPYLIK